MILTRPVLPERIREVLTLLRPFGFLRRPLLFRVATPDGMAWVAWAGRWSCSCGVAGCRHIRNVHADVSLYARIHDLSNLPYDALVERTWRDWERPVLERFALAYLMEMVEA